MNLLGLIPKGLKRKVAQDALSKIDEEKEVALVLEKWQAPAWLKLFITWFWTGAVTGLTVYLSSDTACLDLAASCARPIGTAFLVGGLTSVVTHMQAPPKKPTDESEKG